MNKGNYSHLWAPPSADRFGGRAGGDPAPEDSAPLSWAWPQADTTPTATQAGPQGTSWVESRRLLGQDWVREFVSYCLSPFLPCLSLSYQRQTGCAPYALSAFRLNQGSAGMIRSEERAKSVEWKRVDYTDSRNCFERTDQSYVHNDSHSQAFHMLSGLTEMPILFVCLENSYSSFKTHLQHYLPQTALIIPRLCYSETRYIHVLLLFTFPPTGSNTCLLIGLPGKLWGLQRLGGWVSLTFVFLGSSKVPSTKEGAQ